MKEGILLKMLSVTVAVPVWKGILVLSGFVTYLLGMWFCAYYMAKAFMLHSEVGSDMKGIIFLMSLTWPLPLGVAICMWIVPRLWDLVVKLWGLQPKFMRKVLYWMQFAVRPIRLAEVIEERKQAKLWS